MNIEVKEVVTKRDKLQFIRFPMKLYAGNKYYIPPLIQDELDSMNPEKNPAFESCIAKYWLAYNGKNIVGRIGAIVNRAYNEKWNKRVMRFSWFDFEEDQEIAKALLDPVEKWALDRGLDYITGPYGFTSFDKHGVLVSGFEELPTIVGNYNYPYYSEILESLGYKKETEWIEYRIAVPEAIPPKMDRVASISLERNKLSVVKSNSMKDLLPYSQKVFKLLNEAYADLPGVVALSDRQIETTIKKVFKSLRHQYLCLIIDENDNLVGLGISVPSLSLAFQKAKGKLLPFGFYHLLKAMKHNDTIDLMLIAVKPEYQNKGVNSILFQKLIPEYQKHNIKFVETNQNQVENVKVQSQWTYFDSRQHKSSCSYYKMIG